MANCFIHLLQKYPTENNLELFSTGPTSMLSRVDKKMTQAKSLLMDRQNSKLAMFNCMLDTSSIPVSSNTALSPLVMKSPANTTNYDDGR